MARRDDGNRGKGIVLTVEFVAATGSTNADMLARAAIGEAREGDWLVAERQTHGRGRQGREWSSPVGNLYASRLVRLRADDPPAPTLALVAGIALHRAIGLATVQLKWPNDLLIDGAKLAGILLERANNAVVVGFGVNIIAAPDLPGRRTTALAAHGDTRSAESLITSLAQALDAELVIWRQRGLRAIREAWLERAHSIGTKLLARTSDGAAIEGCFDGLTDTGALLLRLADRATHVIHAGDVSLS